MHKQNYTHIIRQKGNFQKCRISGLFDKRPIGKYPWGMWKIDLESTSLLGKLLRKVTRYK